LIWVVLGAPFLGREAQARSCRPSLLPNGARFNCSNCHVNPRGGGTRNPFGQAVNQAVGGSSSCSRVFWTPALAALDSDGDGLTNGAELGDPAGTWRSGQPNPGDPSRVTNPGVRDAPPPEAAFVRGDVNADGRLSVTDAIVFLNSMREGGASLACADAADADADGDADVTDAVWTLTFLFQGGPTPRPPFPGCASARLELGCDEFPPCSGL
jgi:hypothetical protein